MWQNTAKKHATIPRSTAYIIQEPITWSMQLPYILALCRGVFTDRFIFRHILISTASMNALKYKGLSTLGAREPVPVYRHKMVLCSPCQTPFWNMCLAARTKQWTAWNLQKLCAHWDPAPTSVHPHHAPSVNTAWQLKISKRNT